MPTAKKLTNVTSTPVDDPYVTTFLEKISEGKYLMSFRKGETIFSQGDRAGSIYFVQTGSVKVSFLSCTGKEAVLAILGPHSFFGEDSLGGQSSRMSTATALEALTVFQVEKRAMLRALRGQPDFSERFMVFLLQRNIGLEEDLCDQLFNHSEKRLARILLKLTHLREHEAVPSATIPELSQETLAEMVGTTRSRTSYFMNKFRRMGLIEYNGHHVTVRTERLTDIILQELSNGIHK